MKKEKLINEIENMIGVILTSPELFTDGIDSELAELLIKIKKYIKEEK